VKSTVKVHSASFDMAAGKCEPSGEGARQARETAKWRCRGIAINHTSVG